MHKLKLSVIMFCALILISASSSKAQEFSKIQVDSVKISDRIHILKGAGGNVGVFAGKDFVLMIDASYAPLTDRIKAAIGAISDRPVKFVVITHWHQDHTGGNENLAREGAFIVSHKNVRRRLGSEQFMSFFGRTLAPLPAPALPAITFEQELSFHLDGEDISIVHLQPAHTDGDVVIHFRQVNVIHTGDIFFNGTYPFIDLSAGGSIDGVISAVRQILSLCNEKTGIIPGHGPLSDKAGLETYLNMLITARDRIAREIGKGKSIDAVIAAQPLHDFDSLWGKGFLKPEQFIKITYDSLIIK